MGGADERGLDRGVTLLRLAICLKETVAWTEVTLRHCDYKKANL